LGKVALKKIVPHKTIPTLSFEDEKAKSELYLVEASHTTNKTVKLEQKGGEKIELKSSEQKLEFNQLLRNSDVSEQTAEISKNALQSSLDKNPLEVFSSSGTPSLYEVTRLATLNEAKHEKCVLKIEEKLSSAENLRSINVREPLKETPSSIFLLPTKENETKPAFSLEEEKRKVPDGSTAESPLKTNFIALPKRYIEPVESQNVVGAQSRQLTSTHRQDNLTSDRNKKTASKVMSSVVGSRKTSTDVKKESVESSKVEEEIETFSSNKETKLDKKGPVKVSQTPSELPKSPTAATDADSSSKLEKLEDIRKKQLKKTPQIGTKPVPKFEIESVALKPLKKVEKEVTPKVSTDKTPDISLTATKTTKISSEQDSPEIYESNMQLHPVSDEKTTEETLRENKSEKKENMNGSQKNNDPRSQGKKKSRTNTQKKE
jgi:hypothetical protein